MINNLAIGLALGLVVLGVIGMFFGGIRNVVNGTAELKKTTIMLVPVAIFGIAYAVLGTFDQAGVATMVLMIGAMALGIMFTGTRGTFKF